MVKKSLSKRKRTIFARLKSQSNTIFWHCLEINTKVALKQHNTKFLIESLDNDLKINNTLIESQLA